MLRYILLSVLAVASPALATSPAEQRGKAFALNNCARCHSIDRTSERSSENRAAVPDAS